MEEFNSPIEKHYFKAELFEDIVNRLKELDVNLNKVTRANIAGVDEFHVRGAEVSKELAGSIEIKNTEVLDVGCGLGGPARMLSDEYNCLVTGIDLSEEYIRTAQKLSELVNLNTKTKFIHGDATQLPFENESFDVVWTQHVQMNVPDKNKFYSEINRVLKKNGYFIYYDILKRGDEEVIYPMPWANDPSISFLMTEKELEANLSNLNFERIKTKDESVQGIQFFEKLLAKIKEFGPPTLGLNVLMGPSTKDKIVNLLNGLKDEKIVLQSGAYKK